MHIALQHNITLHQTLFHIIELSTFFDMHNGNDIRDI